ncbi:MAG: hypothetical protein ACRCWY_13465, partial [Cellulosilyticaceae bacterium]
MIVNLSRVILVVNSAYLLVRGDWMNVIVLLSALFLTYVPYMMEKWLRIRLTKDIINFAIIFVMLSQWLGTYLRAYDFFPWWDVFLHGVSGVLISLVGILFVVMADRGCVLFQNKLYGLIAIIMFLTGSASAVFWEIFEFVGDTYFGTFAQLGSLVDTMEDMIICVLVATVFTVGVYLGLKKEKGGYFVKQIEELVRLNKNQEVDFET